MKSIAARFLLPFGAVAVIFSTLVFYEIYSTSQHVADDLIRKQADMLMEFNQAIREYVAEKGRPALQQIVGKEEFIPETMSSSFISLNVFEKIQRKFPGYIVRFASDNPLNPANRATSEELRVLEFFRQNPRILQKSEQVWINGQRYVAQFKAVRTTAECLRCHGDPKDAPAGLTKRYGTAAGFHRRAGDVAGVDTIAIPVEAVATAITSEMRWKLLVLATWLVFLFSLIMVVFHVVVSRRLAAMAKHIRLIAHTSEAARMTPTGLKENDEIDVLGIAFDNLFQELRAMHASLEQRVVERTAELAKANDGLKQEIAERQRAEEAVRESERRLQATINRAPFGAYFFELRADGQLVLTGANPAAEKVTRAETREFLGRPFEEAFPSLKETEIPAAFRRVAADGEDYQNEQVEWNDPIIRGVFEFHAFQTGANRMAVFFQDITERKRGEDAIRASLQEKTVLLKEVHHRVKNNLQTVTSLLNLQAVRTKNSTALDTLQETGNRVRSMALLHETLYRSEALGRVSFGGYIENICGHLFRSYGPKAAKVKLELHLEEVAVDLDQAVSCGLIINELVSNALKHAFPDGRAGKIVVELQKTPDKQIVLKVADDGVGIPPGADIHQTGTLGHQLVFMLAEKLRGAVEVIREHGAAFRISFPARLG
jgi:two-component sensor histidine kinase/PAS domain-containing protein